MFIGSTIGSIIPSLWGADMFSLWGIFLSALGGAIGIYFGFKLSN